MENAAKRQPYFQVRSSLSWAKAGLWAALLTTILLVALNWRGCWFFRHEPKDSVFFVYVFVWLLAFFALRTRWQLVLLAITLIIAVPRILMMGAAETNSGPESAAVQALHRMQSGLHAYQIEHQAYPEVLSPITLSPSAQRFYRFDYVPNRAADGKIRNYRVQATPARRDCYPRRSFTITNDGKAFWTLEPRAATTSDELLQEYFRE